MKMLPAVIAMMAAALCAAPAALAQETTLRVVSAFPENSHYVKRVDTSHARPTVGCSTVDHTTIGATLDRPPTSDPLRPKHPGPQHPSYGR